MEGSERPELLASISGEGPFVAFVSEASNLIPAGWERQADSLFTIRRRPDRSREPSFRWPAGERREPSSGCSGGWNESIPVRCVGMVCAKDCASTGRDINLLGCVRVPSDRPAW